jgi:hypothetical protein
VLTRSEPRDLPLRVLESSVSASGEAGPRRPRDDCAAAVPSGARLRPGSCGADRAGRVLRDRPLLCRSARSWCGLRKPGWLEGRPRYSGSPAQPWAPARPRGRAVRPSNRGSDPPLPAGSGAGGRRRGRPADQGEPRRPACEPARPNVEATGGAKAGGCRWTESIRRSQSSDWTSAIRRAQAVRWAESIRASQSSAWASAVRQALRRAKAVRATSGFRRDSAGLRCAAGSSCGRSGAHRCTGRDRSPSTPPQP